MRLDLAKVSGAVANRPPSIRQPGIRATVPVWLRGRRLAVALLAGLAVAGCGKKEDQHYESASKKPSVRVTHPELRTIIREVGQPSFIEAYERTSIYPKLTGYIEKWIVDIGDRVRKGQMLATLFIPELVEEFGSKKATVTLDEQRVEMAKKIVEVAAADLRAAQARLEESQSILGKYQAEADRWDVEVKRLTREVSRGVIDPQVLLESTNQYKSSTAARDAARATIRKAEAEVLSYEATYGKTKVDVGVAGADLAVATSEAKRVEALVGYITLSAPFDGIVVARNANTSDFVQPSNGDPSALNRSPYEAPGGTASPIYVVDRTDIVRIFIDIPEQDANYVHAGTTASVLARGYRDEPIPGTVTRTSWALNIKSRTLRAEIDLPNPGEQLLPGMYAYATVSIVRPNSRSLPTAATTTTGDKTYCWMYQDGKAKRTEVRTGVTDGTYVEVTSLNAKNSSKSDTPWMPITGAEQIIVGDISTLQDNEPVDLNTAPATGKDAAKSATAQQTEAAGAATLAHQP